MDPTQSMGAQGNNVICLCEVSRIYRHHCVCVCVYGLPLLLLQVMVAALLALQVKFGVLQFSCQSLAFLLQLLDVAL